VVFDATFTFVQLYLNLNGGGNQGKPPIYHKSLTNVIAYLCDVSMERRLLIRQQPPSNNR